MLKAIQAPSVDLKTARIISRSLYHSQCLGQSFAVLQSTDTYSMSSLHVTGCHTYRPALPQLLSATGGVITGTHTTPVSHYVDELKFSFVNGSAAGACRMEVRVAEIGNSGYFVDGTPDDLFCCGFCTFLDQQTLISFRYDMNSIPATTCFSISVTSVLEAHV